MTEGMVKSQGIDAHAEVMGKERTLPVETQLLLFRIAQEALNNIRRHAEASRAVVKLEFGDNSIKMTVSDNGKGFELPERMGDLASNGKLGLAGMQERARLLGGSLEVESEPGKGTRVTVEAPV
jgi:signal transduction histidine kinase